MTPPLQTLARPTAHPHPHTAIVFGDQTYCAPSTQFTTTVRSDFQGEQIAPRDKGAVPAGKPLGIKTSDKRAVHIAFGDQGRPDGDRWNTVSEGSYVYRGGMHNAKTESSEAVYASLTPAQRYHYKPATAAQSAHIGLQTRADLPIDDARFCSYQTTHGSAYSTKILPEAGLTAANAAAGYGASNRTSNIPLGDPTKPRSWGTMAGNSWVDHGDQYRKLDPQKSEHRTADLVVMDRNANLKSDGLKSTTSASFQKPPLPQPPGPPKPGALKPGERRGYSSIALGATVSGDQPESSVSRRDYAHDPAASYAARQAVRSSVQDRLLSKPGIQDAIRPTSETQMVTSMSDAYRRPAAESDSRSQAPAAGISFSHPSLTQSSLPQGDAERFPTGSAKPTTLDAYQPYPEYRMPPHPILGANITRSTFAFAAPDAPPTNYESTSRAAHHPHPLDTAGHAARHGRRVLHLAPIGDATLSMSDNRTTHQSHYAAPTDADSGALCRPHGRYDQPHPTAAIKPLLFPTRTSHVTPSQTYRTTFGDFFAPREGLLNGAERASPKGRMGSSIVFGDPRIGYYGDVVDKKSVAPLRAF
ncbi:hypothetical protein HDU86_000777 [Geranomyces michiganensis]|nr:hypothetical protein HDU86_000777 [Geranomyces michiganensis]